MMNHCPYCNANFIQKMARCPMCGATLSGSEEKKPDREQEKTVKVKKNQEESVSKHEEILEEEKDQEKPGHVLSIPNAVASILGWGFGLMLGFVGIGSTTVLFEGARELACSIKELLPACPIVLGGYHVSLLPEQAMEETAFDVVALIDTISIPIHINN